MSRILNNLLVVGTGSGQAMGITGGHLSLNNSLLLGYDASGYSIYQYGTQSNYLSGRLLHSQYYDNGVDQLQINGSANINTLDLNGDGVSSNVLTVKSNSRLYNIWDFPGSTMSNGNTIALYANAILLVSYTATGTVSASAMTTALNSAINLQYSPTFSWTSIALSAMRLRVAAPQNAVSGFYTPSVVYSGTYITFSSTYNFNTNSGNNASNNAASVILGVAGYSDNLLGNGSPFIMLSATSSSGASTDTYMVPGTLVNVSALQSGSSYTYIYNSIASSTYITGAKIVSSGVISGSSLKFTLAESAYAYNGTPTSGTGQVVLIDNGGNAVFGPTSGNASLSLLKLDALIKQGLSASGITRALYINPSILGVAETRAYATYSIVNLGSIGSTVSFYANSVLIGTYSIASAVTASEINNIASVINSGSTGYTIGSTTSTSFIVRAPVNLGTNANGYSTSYSSGVSGPTFSSGAFVGGVNVTVASNWRSIEDTSNVGYSYYQTGTSSKNYFAGKVFLGLTADDGLTMLQSSITTFGTTSQIAALNIVSSADSTYIQGSGTTSYTWTPSNNGKISWTNIFYNKNELASIAVVGDKSSYTGFGTTSSYLYNTGNIVFSIGNSASVATEKLRIMNDSIAIPTSTSLKIGTGINASLQSGFAPLTILYQSSYSPIGAIYVYTTPAAAAPVGNSAITVEGGSLSALTNGLTITADATGATRDKPSVWKNSLQPGRSGGQGSNIYITSGQMGIVSRRTGYATNSVSFNPNASVESNTKWEDYSYIAQNYIAVSNFSSNLITSYNSYLSTFVSIGDFATNSVTTNNISIADYRVSGGTDPSQVNGNQGQFNTTITRYGLLIDFISTSGTVSTTLDANRTGIGTYSLVGWGVYQSDANTKNFFAGKILLGTNSTDGSLLRVSGSVSISGNLSLTSTISDKIGATGPSGYILSATGGGIAWIPNVSVSAGTTYSLDQVTAQGNTTSLPIQIGGLQVNGTASISGTTSITGNTSIVGTLNLIYGSDNVLINNTTRAMSGSGNVSVGRNSMGYLSGVTISGIGNIAIGYNTLNKLTSGGYNAIVGNQAGINITTAQQNSAFGHQSLYSNASGQSNVAIGENALFFNNSNNSTAIGNNSGYNNTGIQNTYVGYNSGADQTSGSYNVIINPSLTNLGITTGSFNVVLGGSLTYSNVSNYVIIGDGQGNRRLIIDNNGAAQLFSTLALTAPQITSTFSQLVINNSSGIIQSIPASLYTITYASSFQFNGNNGTLQQVTLTNNGTVSLTSMTIGINYNLLVTQPASGNKTLNWGTTVKVAYGGSISTAGNAIDKYTILYDGSRYFVDYSLSYS